MLTWIAVALFAADTVACEALTSAAVEAGDFAGASADAHCDRRVVEPGGQAASFCQEIVATVAAAEFSDDCRAKHKARAGAGRCPRERIVAGCKLRKVNDDDSQVWDWYYDEPTLGAPDRPRTVEDVAALCADPSRYEDGADLARP